MLSVCALCSVCVWTHGHLKNKVPADGGVTQIDRYGADDVGMSFCYKALHDTVAIYKLRTQGSLYTLFFRGTTAKTRSRRHHKFVFLIRRAFPVQPWDNVWSEIRYSRETDQNELFLDFYKVLSMERRKIQFILQLHFTKFRSKVSIKSNLVTLDSPYP